MLNNNKLFDAFTDIDDDYIDSAHIFAKKSNIISFAKLSKRGVAAAVIACALIGTTVYAGTWAYKQLHVTSFNYLDGANNHNIPKWEDTISITNTIFNESGFKNLEKESLIDILSSAAEQPAEGYKMVEKTANDAWNRKMENSTYEVYEYEDMKEALADYNIDLNLSYIQEKYPEVAGEYGCDLQYEDDSKTTCLNQRVFSGFRNVAGQFVSVEYCLDNTKTNENPYFVFEGKADTGYFITDDGAEVFITTAKGTDGGSYVSAWVYTEHSILYVGMYGIRDESEIEQILNSLNIVEGMKLDVR